MSENDQSLLRISRSLDDVAPFKFLAVAYIGMLPWRLVLNILLLSCGAFVHALQISIASNVDHTGTLFWSWLSLPWNERAGKDATGNIVFHSLASPLQLMPNSQHPHGTVPSSSVLYSFQQWLIRLQAILLRAQ